MPARHHRSSSAIRRPRRKLEWADFQLDTTTSVGFTVIVDLLSTYAALPGASVVGATVMRTHGRLWVTSTQVAGDGIATGFIVGEANETIAGPGVANSTARVLSTVFNTQSDWLLYQKWNARPSQYNQEKGFLEFDLRSKRKLPELRDTLLFVFDNIDASATVSWSLHTRTLLALP